MVAKGPAISLIEFTGTLLERYRAQAASCDPGFLFGAISVLTDADGKIRQSSNQRLLVELGLMKIAALGQKKNEPTIDDSYPLPELPKGIPTATATPQPVAQPTATVKETTPAENKIPVAEVPSITPSAATPSPVEQPQPPTTPGATEQINAETTSRPATSPLPTLSGASISSLLKGSYHSTTAEENSDNSSMGQAIDPNSAKKLAAAQQRIVEEINNERPRFIVAFETMRFDEHKILLTVPSDSLRDEILHSSTEILLKIAEIAGVKGMLEFDITVKEEERQMRPIKLEDRMAHIEQKNPLYLELKKALDLEVE